MLIRKSESIINSYNDSESIPEDIIPADDGFHGSPKRVAAEWWYFDAIFNNGYSAHLGFRTFSRKKLGMVNPNIEFYKDGKFIGRASKRFLFRNFKTSKEVPLAKLFNKTIIEFDYDRYKKTGEWVYHYKLKIEDNSVDLTFKGITQGWKIETDNESWTVALPKASVTGEIIVNGNKMQVNGIGYHDHNWNYSLLTLMNYGVGWYWGKIRSPSFNLIWANIVQSSKKSKILAIANKDGNGYFNINPEQINFKIDRFTRIRGKKTPSCFNLKIEDTVKNIPMKVDVKMESDEIHYGKAGIAPYWRYHVNSSGFISIGEKKEKVNKTHIMEYLSFT